MMDLALAVKNARLQAIAEAAGEGATFTLYTGPRPVGAGRAASGDLLVALPITGPFADTIENGVLIGTPMDEAMATGAGVAGWGRLTSAQGSTVLDLDVGEEGSGAPATMATTQIYDGMLVEGVAVTLAEP